MSTLALNIRMNGKLVVVIGGGAVALRKLRTLVKAGASIRVVAETVRQEITAMQLAGKLGVAVRSYTGTDLDNAALVIAATDNAQVNEQVASDARLRRILVAVTDNPLAGDCTFPATIQHGDLEIAVSTGGRCPTFASDVRDVISGQIGSEYGTILEQIAAEREKLLTNGSSSTYNTQVLRSLASRLISELTECKESLP